MGTTEAYDKRGFGGEAQSRCAIFVIFSKEIALLACLDDSSHDYRMQSHLKALNCLKALNHPAKWFPNFKKKKIHCGPLAIF